MQWHLTQCPVAWSLHNYFYPYSVEKKKLTLHTHTLSLCFGFFMIRVHSIAVLPHTHTNRTHCRVLTWLNYFIGRRICGIHIQLVIAVMFVTCIFAKTSTRKRMRPAHIKWKRMFWSEKWNYVKVPTQICIGTVWSVERTADRRINWLFLHSHIRFVYILSIGLRALTLRPLEMAWRFCFDVDLCVALENLLSIWHESECNCINTFAGQLLRHWTVWRGGDAVAQSSRESGRSHSCDGLLCG